MGGLTFKGELGNGDPLSGLGVEYSATLAEGSAHQGSIGERRCKRLRLDR